LGEDEFFEKIGKLKRHGSSQLSDRASSVADTSRHSKQ